MPRRDRKKVGEEKILEEVPETEEKIEKEPLSLAERVDKTEKEINELVDILERFYDKRMTAGDLGVKLREIKAT